MLWWLLTVYAMYVYIISCGNFLREFFGCSEKNTYLLMCGWSLMSDIMEWMH